MSNSDQPQHILRELPVVDEVNTLTQDLAQKASILDQGFSPTNNRLGNKTYSQPEASSSRLATASPPSLTLDLSTLTPLERDIVNCIDDKSTDENIETGVHVADFIPDIKELNPEVTSVELRCVIELLARSSVLTIFKAGCSTALWLEEFYMHLLVTNIIVPSFSCRLPAA